METTVTVERMDEETEFLSHEILRENLKTSRRKFGKTKFKCGECGKMLADRASYNNHVQTHSTSRPYHCEQCPYTAKTSKYLARHAKIHEPAEIRCGYCGRMFRRKAALQLHERSHTGEKPNKCDVCGKAFNSKYSLSSHKLIHTDEKPFKCAFCEYACRDSSTLRKHQERHMGIKRYQCTVCEKRYTGKWQVEAHMKEMHISPDERASACDKCDSSFKNVRALRRHIALVHERVKACSCSVCGAHIANSYNLSRHMMAHVDIWPYVCTVEGCERRCKEKNDLKKHIQTHFPNRECDHCGKRFSRKTHLASHIRIKHDHPNTKSEKCEYCGVSFLTPNYLAKHIKQKHTRHRQQYACDMCDFSTHNKPSIVMHIKYGHNYDNKTECRICRKTYKSKVFLKMHYKNEHNVTMKTKPKTPKIKVQVKEEPPDSIPDLEIDLLDIDKEEPFAGFSTPAYNEDSSTMLEQEENPSLRRMLHNMMRGVNYDMEVIHETTNIADEETRMDEQEIADEAYMEQMEGEDPMRDDNATENKDTPQRTETQDNTFNGIRISIGSVKGIKTERLDTEPSDNMSAMETRTEYPQEDSTTEDSTQLVIDEGRGDEGNGTNMSDDENGICDTQEDHTDEETQMVGDKELMNGENVQADVSTAETRTGPMPVEEFIQQVVGDMEDPSPEDDSIKIDKKSMEQMQARIKELILKQRAAEKIRRTDFGRRLLKRVSDDEIASRKVKKIKLIEANFNEDKTKTTNTEIKKKKRDKRIKKNKLRIKVKEQENIESGKTMRSKEEIQKEIENGSEVKIKKKNKSRSKKNRRADNESVCERKIRKRKKTKDKGGREKADRIEGESERETEKRDKLRFNSFQCNVCYKLFETKPQLLEHCQTHFDVCTEITLMKCPLCNFITERDITKHVRTAHKEEISISFLRILDRKENASGSRYYYDTNNDKAKEVEIIPSIKILNKKAGMELDKRNREKNDKIISTPKLVRKGKEWIVEKAKFDLSGYVLPNSKELDKKDTNYLEKLKNLGVEAKKKGIKMLYPCNVCEKVCQNLSALTLHTRKHNPNKKPFAPKVWKHKIKNSTNNNTENSRKKVKYDADDVNHRNAKPKPIVNKHKCDPKLKDFYENNIRGLNIEFWQFLKIYNKMDRENVNDFEDLQNSTEFGIGHANFRENENNEPKNKTPKEKNNVVNAIPKLGVASRKNSIINSKFTRTIRISRMEYNKRKQIQKELREKIRNSESI